MKGVSKFHLKCLQKVFRKFLFWCLSCFSLKSIEVLQMNNNGQNKTISGSRFRISLNHRNNLACLLHINTSTPSLPLKSEFGHAIVRYKPEVYRIIIFFSCPSYLLSFHRSKHMSLQYSDLLNQSKISPAGSLHELIV